MSGEGCLRASASCDGMCDPTALADEIEQLKARIAKLEADSHPPVEIMPLVIDGILASINDLLPEFVERLERRQAARRFRL